MTGDVHVIVHGGVCWLQQPLALGPRDSGEGGHTVRWEAAAGKEPVLSGGVTISGWTEVDATKHVYRASAPAGLATRQMYVDGVRCDRARGPLNPSGWVETATGYTIQAQ